MELICNSIGCRATLIVGLVDVRDVDDDCGGGACCDGSVCDGFGGFFFFFLFLLSESDLDVVVILTERLSFNARCLNAVFCLVDNLEHELCQCPNMLHLLHVSFLYARLKKSFLLR